MGGNGLYPLDPDGAPGQPGEHAQEQHGEDQPATQQHGGIELEATCRVDLSDRPTGARGESSTAPTMASSRPATTASAPPAPHATAFSHRVKTNLVDRELVEEHLGALVGVHDLDPADEAHRPPVLGGKEEVVAVLGEEAGHRVGPGRAVEQVGGRPRRVRRRRGGTPGSPPQRRPGRAWSAAQIITSCSGRRPQATARLSDGPAWRPVPASSAIWTLAGNTATSVATLAGPPSDVRRSRPAAQISSTTPLA